MDLSSSVVVVTGASSGVGRATARLFARHGAAVGLIARNADALKNARSEIEEMGGRAVDVPADIADPDQVEAAAAAIESELGPIDVWVNNAMVSVFSPVKEMTPGRVPARNGRDLPRMRLRDPCGLAPDGTP